MLRKDRRAILPSPPHAGVPRQPGVPAQSRDAPRSSLGTATSVPDAVPGTGDSGGPGVQGGSSATRPREVTSMRKAEWERLHLLLLKDATQGAREAKRGRGSCENVAGEIEGGRADGDSGLGVGMQGHRILSAGWRGGRGMPAERKESARASPNVLTRSGTARDGGG